MATSRPQTANTANTAAHSVPSPHDPAQPSRDYGAPPHPDIDATDFAETPADPSHLSPQRLGRFEEDFDARTRGSSIIGDGDVPERPTSRASNLNQGAAPARHGTLKKRASLKRVGSLKRSGSRRSTYAGSIRGVSVEDEERSSRQNNVFYTPVPTSGSPTDILANRFQAWRKLLKDLITYFREVSSSYESRAKSLLKVSNVVNNTNAPSLFMTEGGLNDANRLLRDFHKQSIAEANKARDIETEVINQLSGLRADLAQKIKEIKSLSGDFKNSVEKEKETTRKCVAALDEALSLVDSDPSAIAGKGDPYVVRLGVDRQVERQIDEENYLHRAYLNLENSGRELESIVVGEIQKAYNALASILKREADEIYSTVDKLRNGPIGMPRDAEWNQFVTSDPHFVSPNTPLRRLADIQYPGKHHPATTEVRAGMLERKSKYLKSYTPGWYVLSPTHLHEFKSADRIYTQPPVMSLYLPDQKLGSHSQHGSSSHKFVLKGRQTGSMHRGHTWVFRAETYDTMLAWYEDVKNLTEKSGEERNAFVRRHVRSISQGSARSIASSDGALEEDEADRVPYSSQSVLNEGGRDETLQRPSPGGRFPSDVQIDRNSHRPLSPSSGSSEVGNDLTTASGGLQSGYPYSANPYSAQPTDFDVSQAHQQDQIPQSQQYASEYLGYGEEPYLSQQHYQQQDVPQQQYQQQDVSQQQYQQQDVSQQQYQQQVQQHDQLQYEQYQQFHPPQTVQVVHAPIPTTSQPAYQETAPVQPIHRNDSTYGDWMAPAAGGAAAGALGAAALTHREKHQEEPTQTVDPAAALTHREMHQEEPTQTVDPAPTSPSFPIEMVPVPIAASSANDPFLDKAEAASAAASSPVMNGGTLTPVQEHIPKLTRNDTEISVSDLHVPGEYPRVKEP